MPESFLCCLCQLEQLSENSGNLDALPTGLVNRVTKYEDEFSRLFSSLDASVAKYRVPWQAFGLPSDVRVHLSCLSPLCVVRVRCAALPP